MLSQPEENLGFRISDLGFVRGSVPLWDVCPASAGAAPRGAVRFFEAQFLLQVLDHNN